MRYLWFATIVVAACVSGIAVGAATQPAEQEIAYRKPLAPMKLLLRDGKTVVTIKETATGVQVDISNLQVGK